MISAFVIFLALHSPAGAAKNAAGLFDAAAVNNPALTPAVGPKSRGSAIVRAQILIARARFSPGEIDGRYGANLFKAVRAFQDVNKLPVTGAIDAQTWAALNRDKAPALGPYTISQQDVAGPFEKNIPADLMQQAKLPALSYRSPQELLGEKFHVKPDLLAALNPGKPMDRAGSQITVPNVLLQPPGEAATVRVSKSCGCVSAFGPDGKLLAWYSATIGSAHDPLPIGTWKIEGVARNPVFHYNSELFWDAEGKNEKAQIKPGPNNPVGVVWIDLSKPHYGFHGTPEPAKVGHTTSHGCIRLTNWDALELASMVKPGTPAILTE